jgi:hypothetical protein
MPRASGRRSGGQYGRRRDEEYGQDEETSARPEERGKNADSLIADMAKGFVEAQAKIAGPLAGGDNREMMVLLEKISRQLEELKTAPAGGENGREQGQDKRKLEGGGQGQSGQQAGQQAELSAIFSQLLSSGKGTGASPQKPAGQESGGQQCQKSADAQGNQAAGGGSVTARTAAQALAQAQYELANELEASLAKLKQVISESEKLADKISNLLGQESGSGQT